MKKVLDLQQLIYDLIKTQIKFGTFHYGEQLPTMETASRWLMVSMDTVRSSYLQLRDKGYITLTQKVGATVNVAYSEEEIEQNIQDYFAARRNALKDLDQIMWQLFSRAELLSLKCASSQTLDKLEALCYWQDSPPIFMLIQVLPLIYGTFENSLFMRLIWQIFIFFQAPFLSLPENSIFFPGVNNPQLHMIHLCRKKDWTTLQMATEEYQVRLSIALQEFYQNRITDRSNIQQISFQWNIYKQPSQLCYSLVMDFLSEIRWGVYPAGTYLPSLKCLAAEKKVSVSTIRRTITHLNHIGATQSINGVGTKALSSEVSAEHCDFSNPIIRKNLVDFVQGLQIFSLSCRAATELTFSLLDHETIRQWIEYLQEVCREKRYEDFGYNILKLVTLHVPFPSIKVVYSQLLKILLWGYPLKSIHGDRESVNSFYSTYVEILFDCLVRRDGAALAATLEELMDYELGFAVRQLCNMKIIDASAVSSMLKIYGKPM